MHSLSDNDYNNIDLLPAQWIWIPCQRTLQNTFVLFRKSFDVSHGITSAKLWITGDSRYRLLINGKRVGWGPAPFDPRHMEVDMYAVEKYLCNGENVIAVEVLWYGQGEGTYILSSPGLIFRLDIEYDTGEAVQICSNTECRCKIDRAHPPGQHAQWFLRALQESFDARCYSWGWDVPGYLEDGQWLSPARIELAANRPLICSIPTDVAGHYCGNNTNYLLKPRTIPNMEEVRVQHHGVEDWGRVHWLRHPDDWFDFRLAGSFEIEKREFELHTDNNEYIIPECSSRLEGYYVTLALNEQMVGWPYITVEAPEGTIIEIIEQESHDLSSSAWLDTHYFNWQRFICKEGINEIQTFDFYCYRWLQIHIRNNKGKVGIKASGIVRRLFPFEHVPFIRSNDERLGRVFMATVNTMKNSLQEINGDGFGRERQQYSGDCGHQQHVARCFFGEYRLAERYLLTYSQGFTPEGYPMDCWPGTDRLWRVTQRILGTTEWGPIIDHGVQFIFDCWDHYMETGRDQVIKTVFPVLVKFCSYLDSIISADDGMLPVDDEILGVPSVWMDHFAWKQKKHKKCAFNLYVVAMMRHAYAPLCRLFGYDEEARHYEKKSDLLLEQVINLFWCKKRKVFVDNFPWEEEEKETRFSDRSLATAVLFELCPDGENEKAISLLAAKPTDEDWKSNVYLSSSNMGLSYPPNAVWRYRALLKAKKIDVILDEIREIWANMPSVIHNNTISELWIAWSDGCDQWSHCAVAPLIVLCEGIAGIIPESPGFKDICLKPLGTDIKSIETRVFTPYGPVDFKMHKENGRCFYSYTVPENCGVKVIKPNDCNAEIHVERRDMQNIMNN